MAAAKKSTGRASGTKTGSGTGRRGSSSSQRGIGTAGKSTAKRSSTGNKKTSAAKKHKRTAEELNTYKDQLAFETGITILVLSIISIFLYSFKLTW